MPVIVYFVVHHQPSQYSVATQVAVSGKSSDEAIEAAVDFLLERQFDGDKEERTIRDLNGDTMGYVDGEHDLTVSGHTEITETQFAVLEEAGIHCLSF